MATESGFKESGKIYFGVDRIEKVSDDGWEHPLKGDVWVRRTRVEDEITMPSDEDPTNPRLVQQRRTFLQGLGIDPDRPFAVGYAFNSEMVMLRQEAS